MTHSHLLQQAIEQFDTLNAQDPRRWKSQETEHPQELFFSQQHTSWVQRLDPEASESLLLASRCQHLCRWEIPRQTYPEGRAGYLKWRSDLKQFHAKKAAEVLSEIGYDAATIERVQSLNLKKNLNKDPECQTLEDALCLTFLEQQFDDLIQNTEEEKMLKIIQKTWKKMSPQGQAEALKLSLSETALQHINKALA